MPDRPAAPAPGLVCVGFKPVRRNSLQGFADILLPKAGLVLVECSYHEKDGAAWCNPPAREIRDASGTRTGWKDAASFVDKAARRAWSDAAVAAVQDWRRTHPEAEEPRQDQGRAFEW